MTTFMHTIWLLLTLVAGKWATGTIARLLGFVAARGVASWTASIIVALPCESMHLKTYTTKWKVAAHVNCVVVRHRISHID